MADFYFNSLLNGRYKKYTISLKKSIIEVKSDWKNDINYCKSRWKNVSLQQESPHNLVSADRYYQSPQDELPDMAARLYFASGMSLHRVV